jgi:hypothetical protein
MTPTNLSSSNPPDDLPLLTQVVKTDMPDDLPTLTEVVVDSAEAKNIQPPLADAKNSSVKTVIPPSRVFSEAELQQILQHLEPHLDIMFAEKLSLHFEKLRDALNAHLDSKIQ